MKNILKRSLIFLFLLFVFNNCSKNSTNPTNDVKFNFPISQGSQWEYKVTDSEKNITKEIWKISGYVKANDKKYTKWWKISYWPNGDLDSLFMAIRSTDSGIYYLRELDETREITLLSFPLKKDKTWNFYKNYSAKVVGIEDIVVNGHTFKKCYKIEVKDADYTYWVCNNIGIVKKIEGSNKFEIINYTIK